MKILISSVHKRSGLLYQRYRDYYGKNNDDILLVHGTTLQFNPRFDEDIIDFTAAIAHRGRDGKIVLDVLYERRSPFNPSEVVAEIVVRMREYRCGKITGDEYAANWTIEAFAKAGARYEQSQLDRSAVYMNTLPIFTSGRARLLDNQKMVSQFAALERRTFSTGRERIDPGPGHDDLRNSAAIALSLADNKRGPLVITDEMLRRASIPSAPARNGEPWGPPARCFF